MAAVHTFTPLTVRGEAFANRVWVSPMCQYSAIDGVPQEWHRVHIGGLTLGGPGLVMVEATGVSPEGRITPWCAGIWTDEQADVWADIVAFARSQGVPLGIQLGHAGRKASTAAPWTGGGTVAADAGGWQTVGPSAVPFAGLAAPRELTLAEIDGVVDDFVAAAKRAVGAGFRVIEIHGAHGYLLHQFLSPLSNHRTDAYGGSFENRTRLLLRIAAAVRAVVPDTLPVFTRLSATDWVDGGWNLDETVRLASLLAEHGVDLIDISSGGLDARQQIPVGPLYQVPLARAVRAAVDIPVTAVGIITAADEAERLLDDGSADAIFVGRQFLRDRDLPRTFAADLGVDSVWPVQYERGEAPPLTPRPAARDC